MSLLFWLSTELSYILLWILTPPLTPSGLLTDGSATMFSRQALDSAVALLLSQALSTSSARVCWANNTTLSTNSARICWATRTILSFHQLCSYQDSADSSESLNNNIKSNQINFIFPYNHTVNDVQWDYYFIFFINTMREKKYISNTIFSHSWEGYYEFFNAATTPPPPPSTTLLCTNPLFLSSAAKLNNLMTLVFLIITGQPPYNNFF